MIDAVDHVGIAGKNLDEAKEMAKEAIELHCEGLFADNLAEVRVFDKTWA